MNILETHLGNPMNQMNQNQSESDRDPHFLYSEENVRQENHRLRKLKLETQKTLTLSVHKLKNDINTLKLQNVNLTQNLEAYSKVMKKIEESRSRLEIQRKKEQENIDVYQHQIDSTKFQRQKDRATIVELHDKVHELRSEKEQLQKTKKMGTRQDLYFAYDRLKRKVAEKRNEKRTLENEVRSLHKITQDVRNEEQQREKRAQVDDYEASDTKEIGMQLVRDTQVELSGLRTKVAQQKKTIASLKSISEGSRAKNEIQSLRSECYGIVERNFNNLSKSQTQSNQVQQMAYTILNATRETLDDITGTDSTTVTTTHGQGYAKTSDMGGGGNDDHGQGHGNAAINSGIADHHNDKKDSGQGQSGGSGGSKESGKGATAPTVAQSMLANQSQIAMSMQQTQNQNLHSITNQNNEVSRIIKLLFSRCLSTPLYAQCFRGYPDLIRQLVAQIEEYRNFLEQCQREKDMEDGVGGGQQYQKAPQGNQNQQQQQLAIQNQQQQQQQEISKPGAGHTTTTVGAASLVGAIGSFNQSGGSGSETISRMRSQDQNLGGTSSQTQGAVTSSRQFQGGDKQISQGGDRSQGLGQNQPQGSQPLVTSFRTSAGPQATGAANTAQQPMFPQVQPTTMEIPPSISSTTTLENSDPYNVVDFLLNSFENAMEYFGENKDVVVNLHAQAAGTAGPSGGAVANQDDHNTHHGGGGGPHGQGGPGNIGTNRGGNQLPQPEDDKFPHLDQVLCDNNTDFLFEFFRRLYHRLNLAMIRERKAYFQDLSESFQIVRQHKLQIKAAQRKHKRRREHYESQLRSLEQKSANLLKNWEVRSGSDKSLQIMTNFYLTQCQWLEKVVQSDEKDRLQFYQFIEDLIQNPDVKHAIPSQQQIQQIQQQAGKTLTSQDVQSGNSGPGSQSEIENTKTQKAQDLSSHIFTDFKSFIIDRCDNFLADKRQKKILRLKQIQISCVNIEKDNRHLEMAKLGSAAANTGSIKNSQNTNDNAALDASYLRWTAAGDVADADAQVEMGGFVLSKLIYSGRKQIKKAEVHSSQYDRFQSNFKGSGGSGLGHIKKTSGTHKFKSHHKAHTLSCYITVTLISDSDILISARFDDTSMPRLNLYTSVEQIRFSSRQKKNQEFQGHHHHGHTVQGAQGGTASTTANSRSGAGEGNTDRDNLVPATATFLSFSFGSKVSDLLEVEIRQNQQPRLKLQGQDSDRQDDHSQQRVQADLESDCVHNDSKIYHRENIQLAGFNFNSTLMMCKNTKYGVSNVHINLHMPQCNWTRWCTTTARRFWSIIGVNSQQELISSQGNTISNSQGIVTGNTSELGSQTGHHHHHHHESGHGDVVMKNSQSKSSSEIEEAYDRYLLTVFQHELMQPDFLASMLQSCPELVSEPIVWLCIPDETERRIVYCESLLRRNWWKSQNLNSIIYSQSSMSQSQNFNQNSVNFGNQLHQVIPLRDAYAIRSAAAVMALAMNPNPTLDQLLISSFSTLSIADASNNTNSSYQNQNQIQSTVTGQSGTIANLVNQNQTQAQQSQYYQNGFLEFERTNFFVRLGIRINPDGSVAVETNPAKTTETLLNMSGYNSNQGQYGGQYNYDNDNERGGGPGTRRGSALEGHGGIGRKSVEIFDDDEEDENNRSGIGRFGRPKGTTNNIGGGGPGGGGDINGKKSVTNPSSSESRPQARRKSQVGPGTLMNQNQANSVDQKSNSMMGKSKSHNIRKSIKDRNVPPLEPSSSADELQTHLDTATDGRRKSVKKQGSDDLGGLNNHHGNHAPNKSASGDMVSKSKSSQGGPQNGARRGSLTMGSDIVMGPNTGTQMAGAKKSARKPNSGR